MKGGWTSVIASKWSERGECRDRVVEWSESGPPATLQQGAHHHHHYYQPPALLHHGHYIRVQSASRPAQTMYMQPVSTLSAPAPVLQLPALVPSPPTWTRMPCAIAVPEVQIDTLGLPRKVGYSPLLTKKRVSASAADHCCVLLLPLHATSTVQPARPDSIGRLGLLLRHGTITPPPHQGPKGCY